MKGYVFLPWVESYLLHLHRTLVLPVDLARCLPFGLALDSRLGVLIIQGVYRPLFLLPLAFTLGVCFVRLAVENLDFTV